MAKRKTPKAKDLMAEKVTNQQLIKLQGLVKAITQTQNEIGVLSTRQHNLAHQVFEYQGALSNLQKEFKEQYGTDEISISDGKIEYNGSKSNS